jgi:hypothetical protein
MARVEWRGSLGEERGRVEDGRGCWRRAPSRFPTPLIKPDVPISGIRLSTGFIVDSRTRLPVALGAETPPRPHTPVPQRTGGCLARTPCAAFSRRSVTGHKRTRQSPDTPDSCSRRKSTAADLVTADSGPGFYPALPGSSPITTPFLLPKLTRSKGSFPPPALPGITGTSAPLRRPDGTESFPIPCTGRDPATTPGLPY